MDKEEVLLKSRKENQDADLFEKDVLKAAGGIGAIVAVVLATIFFLAQVLLGQGMNYGFYAIVFSVLAAEFSVKAFRLKRRHEIAVAVTYTVITVLFTAAHLYSLIFIRLG